MIIQFLDPKQISGVNLAVKMSDELLRWIILIAETQHPN